MNRFALIIIAVLLASCQSKEESTAQKAIDRYIIFVDSINKADFDKRKERWDFIEMEYKRKRNDAATALDVFKGSDREREHKRIVERDAKFEGVRAGIGK
jgi:hypothetical protein